MAEGFELVRGALLYRLQGLVAGLKRGPHAGLYKTASPCEGCAKIRMTCVKIPSLRRKPPKLRSTVPVDGQNVRKMDTPYSSSTL